MFGLLTLKQLSKCEALTQKDTDDLQQSHPFIIWKTSMGFNIYELDGKG